MYDKFKKWIKLLMMPSVVFLSTGFLTAQTIQISIPDSTYLKGAQIKVPVRISNVVAGDNVFSGQFSLVYNSGTVKFTSVDVSGTLLNGKSVAFNPTTKSLAFSSVNAITGSGVLIYLVGKMENDPNPVFTSIGFSDAKLNEGNPAPTTVTGYVRTKVITISPKSVSSSLVVGDSVQFTVTGNVVGPLQWTSKDPSIASVSSTGKMKGLKVGTTRILVTDSQGLQDSTNLFPINSPLLKSLTVSIHDTSYTQTLYFNMPIYISDVSSLGITSAGFTVNYNSSRLTAVGLVHTNSKSEGWSSSYIIGSGNIAVSMAGSEVLSGSGKLVYIRFRVNNTASGNSTVSLSNVLFNESINANLISGTFTPKTAPTVVIAPNTAILTSSDTLRFKVTSGGTKPFKWSTSNPSIASIDQNSGLLTAIKRGTVTVSVIDSFGFTGTSGNILVNDVLILFPDASVYLGDSIGYPIQIEDVTDLGISAFQTTVAFDSTKIKYLGFDQISTLSSAYSVTAVAKNGVLKIAAAGANNLTGSGTLLKLKFKPTGLAVIGNSTTVSFSSFTFNEGATVTATTKSGMLTFAQKDALPSKVILIEPANHSRIEADSVKLVWFKSNPNVIGYKVTYFPKNNEADVIAQTIETSDTTAWVSGLMKFQIYQWNVSAINSTGIGLGSDIWEFELTDSTLFPQPVMLLSPVDNEMIEADSVKLIWTKGQNNSTQYWLEYSWTNSSFSNSIIDSSLTDTLILLKPLQDEKTYWWKIKAKNQFGWGNFSEVGTFKVDYFRVGVHDDLKDKSFALSQNYPNPFNPKTTISYKLQLQSFVDLRIYDLLGREVKTLVNENKPAGIYQVDFNAINLPSGVYIYKLKAGTFTETRKMTLMK